MLKIRLWNMGQTLTPCPRSSPLRPYQDIKRKESKEQLALLGKREGKKVKDKTFIRGCKGDEQTEDIERKEAKDLE